MGIARAAPPRVGAARGGANVREAAGAAFVWSREGLRLCIAGATPAAGAGPCKHQANLLDTSGKKFPRASFTMVRQLSLRRLLFLLFVLLVVAVHAQDGDYEEVEVEEVDFDYEEEPEPIAEEPVPEPELEPESEPEPTKASPVAKKAALKLSLPKFKLPDIKLPEVKIPGVPKQISAAIDSVQDQTKKAVTKVKSISKKDAKKVAAAVLGVWGIGVGVGWLSQNAKPVAAVGNGKKAKK